MLAEEMGGANCYLNSLKIGTFLAVQWLGRCASTAGGMGSMPGRGTKILQAKQRGLKNLKK